MSYRVKQSGEVILQETRSLIAKRYRTVTKAVNREFRESESETANSMYVGSYGRGTAIDTSDIDILVDLPEAEYARYNAHSGNGQSRLLQAVRSAIQTTYPRSDIRADGQVVKVTFSDGMKFEILPAFRQEYFGTTYTYPDANMGGNWRSTNPKSEQESMKQKNTGSNGLLYDTCKHFRRVRDDRFSNYHLSGIVIDSFVYVAMGDWHWLRDGEASSSPSRTYEQRLLDYFEEHSFSWSLFGLAAPGSEQSVDINGSITCLEKVLKYIAE